MPTHSKKQHDFMQAVAHNKEFAEKVNVPQDIAKDFVEHDKELNLFQTSGKQKKSKRIKGL